MKRLLPLLADIGNGIVVTLVAGLITQTPLTWHFLIGIACALLPDIDAIPRLLRTGSVVPTETDPRDHREYLHYPLIFIGVGLILCMIHAFWGMVFVLATVLHFVNDTWGTGPGLMWLWPLSKRKFKWEAPEMLLFSEKDQRPIVNSDSKNVWIDESYLRPTAIAVIEYSIFIFAIICLLLYFIF